MPLEAPYHIMEINIDTGDNFINWNDALEQCDDDVDFLRELLADLRDEMMSQLKKMAKCFTETGKCLHSEEYHCLEMGAHAIKGAASNLMCEHLRQGADNLERSAGKARDAKEKVTEDMHLEVEEYFNELRSIAEAYRNRFELMEIS